MEDSHAGRTGPFPPIAGASSSRTLILDCALPRFARRPLVRSSCCLIYRGPNPPTVVMHVNELTWNALRHQLGTNGFSTPWIPPVHQTPLGQFDARRESGARAGSSMHAWCVGARPGPEPHGDTADLRPRGDRAEGARENEWIKISAGRESFLVHQTISATGNISWPLRRADWQCFDRGSQSATLEDSNMPPLTLLHLLEYGLTWFPGKNTNQNEELDRWKCPRRPNRPILHARHKC